MNKQHYDAINKAYQAISTDVQGLNAHRYGRNITGGNQEFIEAISFEHYLQTQTLITFDQTVAKVSSLGGSATPIPVTESDYILGIYDMTGELMKFAVTLMAMTGEVPKTVLKDDEMEEGSRRNALNDLRELRALLSGLSIGGTLGYEANKKKEVMQASVQKVENALYGLIVRGAERPKGWMPEERSGGMEPESVQV
jgi:predicted translin family RNA/ssDNA-binding protein